MKTRCAVLGLVPVLLTACVTTTTSSTTWSRGGAPPHPVRHGEVEWLRESVEHKQGNPVGGAAVGAVVGGLLGHAIIGRPSGTLLGAAGGAAAGASASQGSGESVYCDVSVRFDDVGRRAFRLGGPCPYRIGDGVVWTARGLERGGPSTARGPSAPPVGPPPPPPPNVPPPP